MLPSMREKVLGSAESFDLLKTRPHVTSCSELREMKEEKEEVLKKNVKKSRRWEEGRMKNRVLVVVGGEGRGGYI